MERSSNRKLEGAAEARGNTARSARRRRVAVAGLAACAGGLAALLLAAVHANAPKQPGRPGAADPAADFKLRTASVTPTKTFAKSQRPAVRFRFRGGEPADVQVDVVRADTDAVVRSLVARTKKPPDADVVHWDGRTQTGAPAPDGKYEFRVGALYGQTPKATPQTSFELTDDVFPVQADHKYRDGFDAGRGHQGQDVFARCGSPIVVAQAGKVTFNKYDVAAGNYVVIATEDGHDEMYAHLRKPSALEVGDSVGAGEPLGEVGQTGDAWGCHLHFEYWTHPWQQGGRALRTVTAMLKRWDVGK